MIGTGFSFEDGEQILVSVQKPFGIVLEQGSDENDEDDRIVVTEVDPNGSAGNAGVREGDILVAVQNASTISAELTEVLEFIANRCPRVVNLRFQRPK
jgi:C-terminal processing protease CtpA/Prc